MHFAMPPRKTSRPPPYAARNNQTTSFVPPALRNLLRNKPRFVVGAVLGFLTLLWLLGIIGGGSPAPLANIPKVAIGSGAPVVIVTVLDPSANPAWVQRVKANREDYAKKHGMPPQAMMLDRLAYTYNDHRLPHTLPYPFAVSSQECTANMGPCPRPPPCHDPSPRVNLLLVP